MRCLPLAALICCLTIPFAAVHAANPRLADNDAASESAADLGLAPAPQDDHSTSSTQPESAPVLPNLDPDSSASPATSPNIYSPPAASPALTAAQAPMMKPSGGTQIIQIPYTDPVSEPMPDTNAPVPVLAGHDLLVSVNNGFRFLDQDFAAINRILGYSSDDAQKHCHVSISGMIGTDKAPVFYQMGPDLMRAVVHLDGTSSSISVIPVAMCDPLPLPQNAGMITQMGDKYMVPLPLPKCQPPPPGAQQFDFLYGGNGQGRCTYQ